MSILLGMIRSPTAALLVLTFINLFNYIDRYVIAAILPGIKKDLALTDQQLGWLSSSFVIVYMLTSPLFGRLGDTRSRTGLIALGVAIWSLATGAAGLARSFGQLFATRAAVGVGEAAYGTISPAVIADYFAESVRGRVYAVFFCAIPVGSALGFVIGGTVAASYGWRVAFFVAGLPGLLLALLALLVDDPPRGAHDDVPGGHAPPKAAPGGTAAAYLFLLRIADYRRCVLGYAAYTFGLGGLAFWMPTFLQRVRGVPLDDAGQNFGAITVASGFIGTFAGGWLGDGLLRRGRKNAYLLISGVTAALAVPFAIAGLMSPTPTVYYGSLFAAEVLLFASTSPINAVIVNVVPIDMRATAVALSILAIHLLGDAISPTIIGATSDALGGDAAALGRAVLIVPAAIAVSAAIWTYAALRQSRTAAA